MKYAAFNLYQGRVTHHRLLPKHHAFEYTIFMTYVDLAQLPNMCQMQRFWSLERFNLACFRQRDFGDGSNQPLTQQIKEFIQEQTQTSYQGKVFLLCHWRYFGILFNPIALYYCFDEQGIELQHVVAEVTNTPWLQRHRYLLTPIKKLNAFYSTTEKSLHVSPFMPMNLSYHFDYQIPDRNLSFNMRVHNDKECVFTANLTLEKKMMTTKQRDRFILFYPWMTAKVIVGIYWQALKIKTKGLSFFPHPSKANWRV
jgi:hypothetical protein